MKHGEENQCIQGFGRQSQIQQTTLQKEALMGGYNEKLIMMKLEGSGQD
jgi:hypothetical protein